MKVGPDGMMGAILAAQGFGLKAMINGPGGCRSRAVNLYRELSSEYFPEEERCCSSKYMSRQSHLPCTYLNSDDMILGSGNKIADGLSSVSEVTDRDIVLIDTLGATIQVTDRDDAVRRSGTSGRVVLANEDLSSMSMAEGYDMTAVEILRHSEIVSGKKGKAAVIGYTMADASWRFGMRNIRELFSLCGIDDVMFIGCDPDGPPIGRIGECSFAVTIHPELTSGLSKELSKMGIKTIVPKCGSPIGYDSMRSFVKEISEMAGTSPDRALSAIDTDELTVKRVLMNSDKDIRGLRGQLMAVEGLQSDIYPLMTWMYDLFSLVPGSVRRMFSDSSVYDSKIDSFLEGIGCVGCIDADIDPTETAAVFMDGLSAELYAMDHPQTSCVGISMPYAKKAELVDRSLVGIGGARTILDTLINGIGRFSCGQPTMADFR